jgi:YidC/Oxa1 family membrane protein insertase
MSEQRNLVLAVGLSLVVLISFNYFYEKPKMAELTHQVETKNVQENKKDTSKRPEELITQVEKIARPDAINSTGRVAVLTPKLQGSVNLKGGRLDDLTLLGYHETTDQNSEEITLLNPNNTADSYFVDFGWEGEGKLPDMNTVWKVSSATGSDASKKGSAQLTPSQSVTIYWDNGAGLRFERTFSVDEDYLFSISDRVINNNKSEFKLRSYGNVTRVGTPKTSGYYILHEGAIGVIEGRLKEFDYAKLTKEKNIEQTTIGGWLGFTDKYWLVALVPDQKAQVQTRFKGDQAREIYSSGFVNPEQTLKPGQTIEVKQNVFAGAKILRLLDSYEKNAGIDRFDLAVDFGWFYFVTKPLFYVLEFLHQLLGNLGVAILVLTVFVKLLFYPLANKSFKSMARMKAVQPKLEALKQRYANDKMRMNQELMELYRKEKINPMSGCLPMLIQAPIFFCLYKVFFVTIEMRHAPFFWWIHDLSAPDPTSIFNLFGLLPWVAPSFLMIGAWPLIMGATMVLQQRMNPQPADPAQAKIMMIMPIMFTYLFASFPAGLVIYWAWSNILTITQQYFITKQALNSPVVVNRTKRK